MRSQKQMLEAYAKRNGLPNPTHLTDDGISGTHFDRPGFTAMMEDVKGVRQREKGSPDEIEKDNRQITTWLEIHQIPGRKRKSRKDKFSLRDK